MSPMEKRNKQHGEARRDNGNLSDNTKTRMYKKLCKGKLGLNNLKQEDIKCPT